MRALILICLSLACAAHPVFAAARLSLGYGMQLNSILNSTLNTNLSKLVLNSDSKTLEGTSGTNAYSTVWSSGNGSETTGAYALVHLPELRLAADWPALREWQMGVYGSISGIVPQTSALYLGSYELKEGQQCMGVDYAKCPLAATNFVGSGGSGLYDAELRSHLRFMNINAGMTLGKKIAALWQGDLIFNAEFGLNVQTFSVNSQFIANRCSSGESPPCASTTQVRVVQSELKTAAAYALGPVLGASLRYERPQAFWFAEIGTSVTFLIARLENSGYTSFLAAGTQAFSQTIAGQGVEATQNIFAVLPSVTLRAGIRL